MEQILDLAKVEEAKGLIAQAKRIVIFTHIAPDGDAMGSSLAMKGWLENTEYRIQSTDLNSQQVTVITPNACPEFLAWLPGAKDVLVYEGHEKEADQVIAEADMHICLDFNEPKRIGPVGERIMLNNCPKIMIDHHLNPSDFATIAFSYPHATSTCELVYRFIAAVSRQSSAISRQIAICLYTGLMTDTGNFAFNSNNPDIYEMIADLLRAGINKDEIYDAVFNQYSPDRLRLIGYALHRKLQLFPEHHLALIALSDEELQRFNYKAGDTEGLVNMPLQISDVYYSVFMREQPPKPGTSLPVIKISFRSQGDRPVNIMAHEVFGGGGHANASGGDYIGSLGRAIRTFLKHYPSYLRKD
ncbi:MAG: DHH family phosphoesterase [Paludibacteraceae bacterium]|nr:DHH family phosphoesterase [Paludibacteraceae bacterium]